MDRRNLILSGILILQVALIAFLFWPNRQSSVAASALLTGVNGDEVTALTVQGNDKTLELSKEAEGWVLANYGDYPVDTVKVTDLISKVLQIDTSRLVASNAASHSRLQVSDDEFVRKLDLTTADGSTRTLLVGSSPNVRATNVRLADGDAVYLTGDLTGSDIRIDVAGWINTTYVQAPTDQVQAVTIQNANATLNFTRVNTDTWMLEGLDADESFNQNNFTTILTRLSGINMIEPVGKEAKVEFGMDQPMAVVTATLKPADGEEKTLVFTIGAKDEEGTNYYAKSSDSEFYVKIASFTGDQFVNDTRERYLQPPPTPDPAAVITDTQAITTALPITSFASLTKTGELSPVAPVTVTNPVTAIEMLTASAALTSTEGLTSTDDLTSTQPVTP